MNLISRFTALQFLSQQITVHGHMHPGLAGEGKLMCDYNAGNDAYGNNGKMQGADFDPAGQYKYGPEIAFDAFSAWAKKTGFKSSQLPAFVKKYTVWNEGTTFETASCSLLKSYDLTAKFPISKLSESHLGACSITCGEPDEAPIVLFDSMQCTIDAPGTEIPLKNLEKVIIGMLCRFLWIALHSPDAIQVYNYAFKVKSVNGGKGGEASGGGDDTKGEGEKGREASGGGDDKKGEGEKKGGENGGGEYGQGQGTPPKDAPAPNQPPPKEAEQPPPQEAEKQPAPQQGGQQSGGPSVEHQGTQQGGQPESGDNYESNAPAPPASRCTLRQ